MTYLLQPNSPKTTINGKQVASGLATFEGPAGPAITISNFEYGSEWTLIGSEYGFVYWGGEDELFAKMKEAGGSVAYWKTIVDRLNSLWTKYFPPITPPQPTEPQTADEAVAWVSSMFTAATLTVKNGTPFLG